MSRYLPKPRGLWRMEGVQRPDHTDLHAEAVMVSLCGTAVPWDGIVLQAEPGRDYDWSPLLAWPVQVLVRPGIDATRTVKALHAVASPYLQLVDIGQWRAWSIASLAPKLKAWPERMPERPEGWN